MYVAKMTLSGDDGHTTMLVMSYHDDGCDDDNNGSVMMIVKMKGVLMNDLDC